MKTYFKLLGTSWLMLCSLLAPPEATAQSNSVYYLCPGNVFTNTITAQEAQQKGCKTREAKQPTTIAGPPSKVRPSPSSDRAASQRATDPAMLVEQNQQKARDSDARRILEAELRKEEDELEALKREYAHGEPDRRSDERNYQKYLDRVAELKASIARKESDVAALRRELSKLPS